MRRIYLNIDRDLDLMLKRYLERQGSPHGLRAETLRRALREFLIRAERGDHEPSVRKLRILER